MQPKEVVVGMDVFRDGGVAPLGIEATLVMAGMFGKPSVLRSWSS